MAQARWILPDTDPATVERLMAALHIGRPLAAVLVNRGLVDATSARCFLSPAFEELHDPLGMRDMQPAIERLQRAIAAEEKILIYGDYDVDGTSAVVILTKGIALAGGATNYHVPHRLKDGYGMRSEVVEQAAAERIP